MLSRFREKGRAAFIPFVAGGSPSLDLCESAVDALVEEGADLLELGLPFSVAMADGPVTQEASEQACKHMQIS